LNTKHAHFLPLLPYTPLITGHTHNTVQNSTKSFKYFSILIFLKRPKHSLILIQIKVPLCKKGYAPNGAPGAPPWYIGGDQKSLFLPFKWGSWRAVEGGRGIEIDT
jgi:hypothetical protein